MKKRLFILLWIIIIPTVNAAVIQDARVVDTILNDTTIQEHLTIKIINNTEDVYLLKLPANADNVIVNGNNLNGINNIYTINLSCITCYFVIEFNLTGDIKETEFEHYTFTRTLNFPSPNSINYSVILPVGFVIQDDFDKPAVVPSPTYLSTDGKNIFITWEQKSPSLPEAFFVNYRHEHSFFVPDEPERNYLVPLLFAIAIIAILSWFVTTLAIKHKKLAKKKSTIIVPSTLFTPDEKKVIDVLKKHDKESGIIKAEYKPLTQKEVGKNLDWSKSKTSAVMTGLEYKKVIEREKFGRNYRVTLIQDIEEKR